jgi:aryl-alcohol dehydrogenase-like predicted oxidoreductase
MVDLADLSRIGFGCYRVSTSSPSHRAALERALRAGCNLIDTASTYVDGASECLVGEVLAEHPDADVFVITKAGYVQGQTREIITRLNERGLAESGLVRLAPDFYYSLHPDFLCCQLDISLHRMRRQWIDGFLLHNPERLFGNRGGFPRDEYYRLIGSAFEFLEEMVAEGKIRFYGISSNTLPCSPERSDGTDLRRLVTLAEKLGIDHHFKLIQFPYNLLETEATEQILDGVSLLDLAHEYGLSTFSNRPLNATSPDGFLRLATYDDTPDLDRAADEALLLQCLSFLSEQMSAVGLTGDPTELSIVKHLVDHWTHIGHVELVTQVFEDYFFPFLCKLYNGSIPDPHRTAYLALYERAYLHGRKWLSQQSRSIRARFVRANVFAATDDRPLQYIACEHYLKSGIDHVLVGMRNTQYVDELTGLFRFPRRSRSDHHHPPSLRPAPFPSF